MALSTISLKAALGSYSQLINNGRDVTAESINRHGEMVRKVSAVVDEVAAKQDGILSSKTLSDQGKSQALAELSTATGSRLAFLERVVHELQNDKRATKEQLDTVKPPAHLASDPVLQYWQGREIRDRLQGLTQQEKDVIFLQAAEAELDPDDKQAQANQDAVLWALQVTPGGPMISPEIMRRALDERAKRTNPDTYARMQQVELLHESLNGLRDSVVGWLNGLGGDPKKVDDWRNDEAIKRTNERRPDLMNE